MRRHQRLRVRVRGVVENLSGGALLDHLAQIQNQQSLCHQLHCFQIVADQEQRHASFFSDGIQQFQYAGTNR